MLAVSDASAHRTYALDPEGLTIVPEITESEWIALGRHLRRMRDRVQWAIGDWLVFGGRHGTGGRWIGSSYDHAQEILGYSRSHLSSLHNVSAAFPRVAFVRQHVKVVAWSLYRATLILDPPERFEAIERAAKERWTSIEMQAFVARCVPDRQSKHKGVYRPRRVKCPKCHHIFAAKSHRYREES